MTTKKKTIQEAYYGPLSIHSILLPVAEEIRPTIQSMTTTNYKKKISLQTKMVHTERVIIDCDPGIDDAMAIILALASPELKIEALTIVHGNHENVELLSQNARRILNLVNKQDIPVYIGARDPLMRPYHGHGALTWHGNNGLGDIDMEEFPMVVSTGESGDDYSTITIPSSHELSAATAIVNLCLKYPGEITLVTIGPQTNVAIALKIEPNLPKYVKRLCMMGGCFNARGNVTPVAEANVYNDPEASKIVFQAEWDICVAPLDVTRQVEMNDEYLTSLAELGYVGGFLSKISKFCLKACMNVGVNEIHAHDPTIIMYLIKPELFHTERAHVDVETTGEMTKGQTIADWYNHYNKAKQANILLQVNQAEFLRIFRERIASYPKDYNH